MWKSPSSIRCWDTNQQPLGCESPPITTRPGLPPNFGECLCDKVDVGKMTWHQLSKHYSWEPLSIKVWISIVNWYSGKRKSSVYRFSFFFFFVFFRKLTNILFLHLDRWSFKLLINRSNVICFCFHKRGHTRPLFFIFVFTTVDSQ